MDEKYIKNLIDMRVEVVCDDEDETTYKGILVDFSSQAGDSFVVLISDEGLYKFSLSKIASIILE